MTAIKCIEGYVLPDHSEQASGTVFTAIECYCICVETSILLAPRMLTIKIRKVKICLQLAEWTELSVSKECLPLAVVFVSDALFCRDWPLHDLVNIANAC